MVTSFTCLNKAFYSILFYSIIEKIDSFCVQLRMCEGHSVQSIPIVNGSLASNCSTTEDDMYTDDEMEGQSEESYTDEETGKETQEVSSENYDESAEEDNNPGKVILNEVYQKMDRICDASIDKIMQEDDITHEEGTKDVYGALVSAYRK